MRPGHPHDRGGPTLRRDAPFGLILLSLMLLSPLGACATAKKKPKAAPDLRPVVLDVKLDGAKQLNAEDIKDMLVQQATPKLHWVPLLNFFFEQKRLLDGQLWEDDRTRIANHYALNGFFDARVTGSQVINGKRRRKDGGVKFVRIKHTLKEGDPSRVTLVQLSFKRGAGGQGAAGIPAERLQALHKRLVAALPLRSGKRFSWRAVQEGKRMLQEELERQTYARSRVEFTVNARPEDHEVEVDYLLFPGLPGVFGAVEISGLDKVREDYVRRIVDEQIQAGAPYDGAKVNKLQREIYGMGLFSLVSVRVFAEPGETLAVDDAGNEILPLQIQLHERKPRTRELGFGIGWEIGRLDTHVGLDLSHSNLFGRRVQGRLKLQPGIATFFTPEDTFPIFDGVGELRLPDFPLRGIALHADVKLQLDVEKGYKVASPSVLVGWTFSPWRFLNFDVSYTLAYFDLFNVVNGKAINPGDLTDVSELEFEDGYLLPALRESLVLDWRDNPLAANKGLFVRLGSEQAGGPLGGSFRFVKLDAELRAYIPLVSPKIVLALRLGGGHIFTWGDKTDVPIAQRLYAGGDGSVRGWKSKYLGPRVLDPLCVEAERLDCVVPIGGKTTFSGSVELRVNPLRKIWIAGFMDLGNVWQDDIDFTWKDAAFLKDLQVSLGGGLRLDTALGRLRLDFAIHPLPWTALRYQGPTHLTRTTLSAGLHPIGWTGSEYGQPDPIITGKETTLRNWNIHFGIGESF